MAVEYSSLARDMKTLLNRLNETGQAHIVLNDWIDLRFSVQDPTVHPDFPIRPYQSLLLLTDPKQLQQELPPDASRSLAKFIEVAQAPTKTFEDIAEESGLPLTHVFRLAAHLVFWKKARIISAQTRHSVYVVSPTARIADDWSLSQDFRREFRDQSMTLEEVMVTFSGQTSLKDHLKDLDRTVRERYLLVVRWLLKRNLIVPLHTFFYLVIPLPKASRVRSMGQALDGADLEPAGASSGSHHHHRHHHHRHKSHRSHQPPSGDGHPEDPDVDRAAIGLQDPAADGDMATSGGGGGSSELRDRHLDSGRLSSTPPGGSSNALSGSTDGANLSASPDMAHASSSIGSGSSQQHSGAGYGPEGLAAFEWTYITDPRNGYGQQPEALRLFLR